MRPESLDDEIKTHIEERTSELERNGATAAEARAQALREFGNRTRAVEETYESARFARFDHAARDLRYGLRQLRRNPGFALTAILTLGLGIGANVAIFQLLDAVRMRTLPVADAGRLVEIKIPGGTRGFGANSGWNSVTFPLWEQIRRNRQGFASVFAWGIDRSSITTGDDTQMIRLAWASGEAFPTLGMRPQAGRLLGPNDDRDGCADPAAVLSYGFWQRHFGGRAEALGARLTLRDKVVTVVGVTPPEFYGLEAGSNFDVALPVCAADLWRPGTTHSRSAFWLGVMGRLAPGWTLERAEANLRQASASWFAAVTPTGYGAESLRIWDTFRLTVEANSSGMNSLRRRYEQAIWLLLAITALVLLMACANLANLLLARALSKAREVAVRRALGATRARVVSELFTESVLLALAGAVLGLALAPLLSRALVAFLSTRTNTLELGLAPNPRVVFFTAAVAIFSALCFGLTTALLATRNSAQPDAASLRVRSASGRGTRFQHTLIVAQIAVSFVLVVAAFSFVESFRALVTIDPGFRQEGITYIQADFERLKLSADDSPALRARMLQQVRSTPGVEAASTTTRMLLNGTDWTLLVPAPDGHPQESKFMWISPGYFATMEIPLLTGRDISSDDQPAGAHVLLVNESFVKTFLRPGDPLGQTVRNLAEPGNAETQYRIVGVVKDTKQSDLRAPNPPIAYAPDAQNPGYGLTSTLVVRSSVPAARLTASIKRELAALNPSIRVNTTTELRATTLDRLARERMLAWLAGFFGALALVLAALGLYGVIAYVASLRRNEIGIRLAIGATRGNVQWLMLRKVLFLLSVGLALGLPIAVAFLNAAGTLLFGIEASRLVDLATAGALVGLITAAAAFWPARRAACMHPMSALRQD
jgi:predicted permease